MVIFWPSWTLAKSEGGTASSAHTTSRSTMTNNSLSWPSRPTSEPKFDAAFRDTSGDRRAQLLPSQRLDRLLRQGFDLFSRQAEREQLLAGDLDLDARIFKGGTSAQEIVFAENLAFKQPGRAIEQGLLQVEHQPRRQIFALGVGHLAAFDDGDNFARPTGSPSRLRSSATVPSSRTATRAMWSPLGTMEPGTAMRLPSMPPCTSLTANLPASTCFSLTLTTSSSCFSPPGFSPCAATERRAEHKPGREQPNPDHYQYPVNGPQSPVISPNRFLNARSRALPAQRTSERGLDGRLEGQARGGLNREGRQVRQGTVPTGHQQAHA